MLKITPLHKPNQAPVYATSWQAARALYSAYKPTKAVSLQQTAAGTLVQYYGQQVMFIETVEREDLPTNLAAA